MKRKLAMLLCTLMLLGLFSGCNGGKPQGKFSIVTTNFATYDWVRCLLGDNPGDISLTLLSDGGTDMHSYQPTADDILTIGQASLFYYVGDTLETWVKGVLNATKSDGKALVDYVKDSLKCSHVHEEDEAHTHVYDEHVWLSLKNATIFVTELCADLASLDPENRAYYEKNRDVYLTQLEKLDAAYTAAAAERTKETVVFADRFPFLYLFSDYALPYHAAFSGCSSESDASFETVSHLAQEVRENNLAFVVVLTGSQQEIAKAVLSTAGLAETQILAMNSLQSVTRAEMEKGMTYLHIMEENLQVLQKALK